MREFQIYMRNASKVFVQLSDLRFVVLAICFLSQYACDMESILYECISLLLNFYCSRYLHEKLS